MEHYDIKVAVDRVKEKVHLMTTEQAVKLVTETEKCMSSLPLRYRVPLHVAGVAGQFINLNLRYALMGIFGLELDVRLLEMRTKASIEIKQDGETLIHRTTPLSIQYPDLSNEN